IVTAGRYVVPTGRVKVPAGRYVVPTGKNKFIVSAGRTKVIPAGSTILVLGVLAHESAYLISILDGTLCSTQWRTLAEKRRARRTVVPALDRFSIMPLDV
ncbi:hypothetical protein Tco_1181658, partial [Tanacetum coccineum]